jgi:hypothetical protein
MSLLASVAVIRSRIVLMDLHILRPHLYMSLIRMKVRQVENFGRIRAGLMMIWSINLKGHLRTSVLELPEA